MHDIDSGRCRRCGTCCKKGGPSLHVEDRRLVDRGIIPCRRLFTIRKGEPAYDNVAGGVIPAENDIVKIKGTGGAWTCVFYDLVHEGCAVYDDRPLECRILKCWDTAGIEAVYRSHRLTRKDLIGGVAGLWDLVDDHQSRCSYEEVAALIPDVRNQRPAAVETLRRMVLYDVNLRRLMAEKGLAALEMIDFLLGRPLTDTLKPMGVSFCRPEGARHLYKGERK